MSRRKFKKGDRVVCRLPKRQMRAGRWHGVVDYSDEHFTQICLEVFILLPTYSVTRERGPRKRGKR